MEYLETYKIKKCYKCEKDKMIWNNNKLCNDCLEKEILKKEIAMEILEEILEKKS